MDEWTKVVTNVGFPIFLVMLVTMSFGAMVWKGLPWIADKVILPITAAHLKLVETLDRSLVMQGESMRISSDAIAKMAKALENLESFIARHHEFTQDELSEAEKLGKFCKAKDRQA